MAILLRVACYVRVLLSWPAMNMYFYRNQPYWTLYYIKLYYTLCLSTDKY
jgi:hypothetical protein